MECRNLVRFRVLKASVVESQFVQNCETRINCELQLMYSISSNFVCFDIFRDCKSVIGHLLTFRRSNVLRCEAKFRVQPS
jgi:hypothetical protein